MKRLLPYSSFGVAAGIVALAVRGRLVAFEIGRSSPNCHGKFYPIFWYSCLGIITVATLLCLVFIAAFITKRTAYRRWQVGVFFAGLLIVLVLVNAKGPQWFIEWLLGDCLDYGLIWW